MGSEGTVEAGWYGKVGLERITLSSGTLGNWTEFASYSGEGLPGAASPYMAFRITEIRQPLINLKMFFAEGYRYSAVLPIGQ